MNKLKKEDWTRAMNIFQVPEEFHKEARKMLSEQEGALILAMGDAAIADPELKTLIAEQAISETPEILIQDAYHRRVLNKERDEAGNLLWKIADFYGRYPYYAQYEYEEYKKFSDDVKRRLNEWDFQVYYSVFSEDVKQKIAGIDTHVHNSDYLTIPETEEFIDRHKEHIYVVPCNCKCMMDVTTKPRNVCLNFNSGDNTEWDRGHGEKITAERAKELVRYWNSQGLMQNGEDYAICNCDGESCYPLQMARKAGSQGIYPRSKYEIEWNADTCIGCGKCAKLCNFQAFEVVGKRHVAFDPAKCWGCTLCTANCPTGAITLKAREK